VSRGRDDEDLGSALSPDPAGLVTPEIPPGSFYAQEESVTAIGLPAFFRRAAALGFIVWGPGIVVAAIDLVQRHNLSAFGWFFLGLLLVVGSIQMLRCGVSVKGERVIVRNLFWTSKLRLADITAVEPATEETARAQHRNRRRVYLVMDGQRLRVDALQAPEVPIRVRNAERLWSRPRPREWCMTTTTSIAP